jgi:response regulator RpfG family c-di-GMP phosphodiesterase
VAGRPRVLVAGTQDAIEMVSEVLRDHADVVAARSMPEALRLLGEARFDSVACNVRFDESRMLEFLQLMREMPAARELRVICFRAVGADLSRSTRNAIAAALDALGVGTFLDLPRMRSEYGEGVASEILRQLILSDPGAR